ncbi:hypothetical protein CTAM01_03401 [Colletotrichum tamarilloi]|uniref:Uncharacterized protein n=1 Tax=Colletotrichum tamarilloi TaxID=1209934 RepID=A0ABQ9RJM8_9PEZI|nr:uncharacterized protein CTAM01_03401 [Colletotrichum tamarilloi]KAK1506066.1 hypothetical protein CTAM01_03401 [Colletotrichum tamarilloi]
MMSILVFMVCVVFWDALYMPAWFGDGIDVVAAEDVILASLLTASLLLEPACFPLHTLPDARRLWLELSVIFPFGHSGRRLRVWLINFTW